MSGTALGYGVERILVKLAEPPNISIYHIQIILQNMRTWTYMQMSRGRRCALKHNEGVMLEAIILMDFHRIQRCVQLTTTMNRTILVTLHMIYQPDQNNGCILEKHINLMMIGTVLELPIVDIAELTYRQILRIAKAILIYSYMILPGICLTHQLRQQTMKVLIM